MNTHLSLLLTPPPQVNAFLSFVVPMVVISALNGVIANQLLRMFREAEQDSRMCVMGGNPMMLGVSMETNRAQSLRHGVLVLREYRAQNKENEPVTLSSWK